MSAALPSALPRGMELETQPLTPQLLPLEAPWSSMWQFPPSQLNLSQPLQCPAGFHHPKSSQAYSSCPSLPYILNCSSRQGVPSNNTMPTSREEEHLGIRVEASLLALSCSPQAGNGDRRQDPFQHQACPPKSLWAGVMLSMKRRDAFPARNTRQ